MPDIAKSRDTTQYNKLFRSQLMKQNCFLFQGTSCHFFSHSHKLHKISFDGAYVLLLHHSGPALLTSTYTTDCHCRKKNGHCLTFESAFLPSYLKRGRSLQFATNWLSFEILRLVNPFKLEVHSETTWPTPKRRHLAQCASFLLLGFWLSMATEKASRLMLVERRPMMLLGASCLFCSK